jgi:2-dehydro-3-deoxyphosphogluconate aldolase/(4S)-4-hydroxy-2-oxoglutarate aldolase
MATQVETRSSVEASLTRSPIISVVRTSSTEEAEGQSRQLIAAGMELIEITFTVPHATTLVRRLLADLPEANRPWIGMGTVTTPERAEEAIAAGAEFLVSPNCDPEVARRGRAAGLFLAIGALTPTEIVAARAAGADLVKVYPLPPVGGAVYLATVRQPLGDIPMMASGGYGVEEIPAYGRAGARAFGIGYPVLAAAGETPAQGIERALQLARSATGAAR